MTHLDKSQALALPTLIKDLGFKGEILMTLPCRQIGTEFIREFYQMNERRVEKGVFGEGFQKFGVQGGAEQNDPFSEKYVSSHNPLNKIPGLV